MSIGILIIRLVIGLTVAAHGAQKLFGWFGGHGPAGTGQWLESIGFRNGKAFAIIAGLGELVGGLLLTFGFMTPIGAALIIAVMTVAVGAVHMKGGYFVTDGGPELPITNAAVALGVACTGSWFYSIDSALGLEWGGALGGMLALTLGLAGGLLGLAARRLMLPTTVGDRLEA